MPQFQDVFKDLRLAYSQDNFSLYKKTPPRTKGSFRGYADAAERKFRRKEAAMDFSNTPYPGTGIKCFGQVKSSNKHTKPRLRKRDGAYPRGSTLVGFKIKARSSVNNGDGR
jgi:hypothetical protein